MINNTFLSLLHILLASELEDLFRDILNNGKTKQASQLPATYPATLPTHRHKR
jgi:hypothetical protein